MLSRENGWKSSRLTLCLEACTAELSDREMLRHNRQIILRGFDFEGQEAQKKWVLVVGLVDPAARQRRAWVGAGVP